MEENWKILKAPNLVVCRLKGNRKRGSSLLKHHAPSGKPFLLNIRASLVEGKSN